MADCAGVGSRNAEVVVRRLLEEVDLADRSQGPATRSFCIAHDDTILAAAWSAVAGREGRK
jgi:hypothetical protein